MSTPIRTTVILRPSDLGKIRRHKSDFLDLGYDLTMGQIIRLAIRELDPSGTKSSSLEGLVGEDRRRKRKSS